MKTISLAVLSVFSLLLLLPIRAAEYHVASGVAGAADDNPGTLAKPWKTIARAATTARAGDTVLLHAGTYPESVTVRNAGAADKPIVLQAFADDEVILEGADRFDADKWQLAPNARNIYATALDRDPGQLFVDGKAVYPKVDQTRKVYPRTYRLGVLTDADRNLYQYDAKAKKLLLALADSPARHDIRVPVRITAFLLSAHCRLAGIRASHYVNAAIEVVGDDSIVEDCLVTDSGDGIWVNGWDRSGVIVRRNTVIGAVADGIYLQDRPTHGLVEDNLVVRCTLNPAHEDSWFGSIKMNGASDTIFAHNVVLEGGNYETDGGHDGWAMWGDIDIVRIMFLGNTCANNKSAGLYVEYTMGDTRAYFNTSYRDGGGITCRQSQRGVFMRNLIVESRGSGIAVWEGAAPYSTTDHVFAHNLVRDCNPAIWFAIEQPNFADYNIYWPQRNGVIAWGEASKGGPTPKYKDLADWVKASGHDLHSEVKDAQPADVGLDTVTFRVADAKDPKQVLMMVGNGGCEYEDPAGQNILPYFWRAGTGDGVEHKFPYAAYCSLKGGTEAFAYRGAGGTVAFPQDSASDPSQPKFAHSGLRYLKFDGQRPAEMCKQGLGFWSPSLPARVADTCGISFFVRGMNLKPTGAASIAAFVEFTDATGQHRQRAALPTGIGAGRPLAGSFDWTQLAAEVKVPDGARRMRVFLGLLPATGQLLLDDVSVKVR